MQSMFATYHKNVLSPVQLEEAVARCPRRVDGVQYLAEKRYGKTPTVGDFDRSYGPLVDYDQTVMEMRLRLVQADSAEYVKGQEKLAALDPSRWWTLGTYLRRAVVMPRPGAPTSKG